jgi:hypothetical protein
MFTKIHTTNHTPPKYTFTIEISPRAQPPIKIFIVSSKDRE